MTITQLLKPIALVAVLATGLSSCIPTPKTDVEVKPAPANDQRPEIRITNTDWPTGDLTTAYALAGDSITFTLSAAASNGIKSIRTARTTSTSLPYGSFTTLKYDTFPGGETNKVITYGYRVPTTTASFIKLGFYLRDGKNEESFVYYRINVLRVTTGTAIVGVNLYRQDLPPGSALPGTVFGQFCSTRNGGVYSRFRTDLGIDLCYGVDTNQNTPNAGPYLFSPDVDPLTISRRFGGFNTSSLTGNAFDGGILATGATLAVQNGDSLRRTLPSNRMNKIVKVQAGKTYLVRCYPLDPLTPPYLAAVQVTSIANQISFGTGGTVINLPNCLLKANISIVRN